MKVVFLTRPGYVVLGAALIFVIGNLLLLYKLVGKSSLKDKHVRLAAKHFGHHILPKDHAKLLANVVEEEDKERGEQDPDIIGQVYKRNSSVHFAVQNIANRFVPENHDASKLLAKHVDETFPDKGQAVKMEPGADGNNGVAAVNNMEIIVNKADSQLVNPDKAYTIAVLVIACNRPTVRRCLDLLLKYRPSSERFPIVVSQDCGHVETAEVVRSYGAKVKLIQQPDLGDVAGVPGNMQQFMGYYKISRHYKWALGQMFDQLGYDSVLIVEDDLDIAPDFFEYFEAARPLLDQDPSLWCVSAWNDNGKQGMVEGNDKLYRTDFFPGLGWMLKKSLWEELKPKWPLGFWDDWLRDPSQRKERACIRPEICRTKTFGRIGVSHGQFFDQHLQYIKLNEEAYPFTKADLSYLLKDNYDKKFLQEVRVLPSASLEELSSGKVTASKVRIEYKDEADFKRLAKLLGAMDDFKAGIPRMAYKGVVSIVFKGTRIYIAPTNFGN